MHFYVMVAFLLIFKWLVLVMFLLCFWGLSIYCFYFWSVGALPDDLIMEHSSNLSTRRLNNVGCLVGIQPGFRGRVDDIASTKCYPTSQCGFLSPCCKSPKFMRSSFVVQDCPINCNCTTWICRIVIEK